MQRARAVSAMILIGIAAGCGSDAAPADDPSVGLVLVRDLPTAPAAGEPVVYEPRELTPLGSDRLAVLDMGDPRIVVVDAGTGEAVQRFARSGEGPGEIKGSWAMLWEGPAGNLLAADPENRRVTRYSASGELLEERPLATELSIGAWLGEPRSDRLYVQENVFDEVALSQTNYVARVDATTGELHRLLPLPEPPPVPDGSFGMVRFFPRPLWTVLPGGRVITGRTDSAVYAVHAPDGEALARLEVAYSPRELTELDRRAEVERYHEVTGSDRVPSFYDLYPVAVRMMPVNDSVFAIQHMKENYPTELDPPAEDQVLWTLISTTGRILDVVAFPPGFVPHWSWNNRVLGIGRDGDGVARLQEWRLEL